MNFYLLGSKLVRFLAKIEHTPKEITVKLGDKEQFDKEQIGVKEPFSVTNCQFTT